VQLARSHLSILSPESPKLVNMNIQLERNLRPHSHRLRCVACDLTFAGGKLRTLLYHQDRSIAGDLCAKCLQQGASHIQQQLKARARELFQQPLTEDISPSPHKQALELWELATSQLVIPPFYYWWWQRLSIFAAETQDLELAKRGALNLRYRQPKPRKITFVKKEPSVDN
jgi:hypothetical protein